MEKYILPGLPTPYFVVDESLLIKNLEILKSVCDRAGCKILLAQKAFSMYRTYPLISQYLYGTTASGLHEARLGKEEFPGETHVFSPAYREDEFEELLTMPTTLFLTLHVRWKSSVSEQRKPESR